MSTTAAVIIADALREIGVIGEDEALSDASLSDGLRMLNRLLDTLSLSPNWAYYQTTVARILTGETSFTVGPTGNVVTNRPIKIESAFVVRDGVSYPVRVIDNQLYDDITIKSLAGDNTSCVYYDGTFPDGTVYPYPVSTGCTLNLRVQTSVKQFPTASTQIEMAEGYEDAIMLKLAVRMAPSYSRPVNPDTRLAARNAMKAVKRINLIVPTMDLPNAVMGGSVSYSDFMGG